VQIVAICVHKNKMFGKHTWKKMFYWSHNFIIYRLALSKMSDNGPFRNCQSWSFITVHGQFQSNWLELYWQVTIWPRKHRRKTPSQAFTRSKQIYRIGRSFKFCGTVHCKENIKLDNVVVYFTVGFATAATVCPDGWVGHTGSCYFFSPTPVHFTEAEV